MHNPPLSRRHLLKSSACGFGYLAFAGLASEAQAKYNEPLAPRLPHFQPRAKRVIMLFMDGGPSHMDLFDYKPQLNKDHGKKGRKKATLYGTPWKFQQRGDSGQWASELLPQLVDQHIDDLCIVKSMHAESSSHPFAVPFFHTGSFQFTRPSLGSWLLYGLGSENESLPGFVTINPSKDLGGPQNFGSAFLPQCYQGTRIGWMGQSVRDAEIQNLQSDFLSTRQRQQQMSLLQSLNHELLQRREVDPQVEGVINSLELGRRMQDEAPAVLDLTRETRRTLDMYGIDGKDTDNFGRMCLMARRFSEAGVRFVQLTHTNWDQHRQLTPTLKKNSRETDQPIAALLTDLKQRGLFDDTLVIWSGEFGRQQKSKTETAAVTMPMASPSGWLVAA